jgi:O-antigen/teichoic acid export membrane protein
MKINTLIINSFNKYLPFLNLFKKNHFMMQSIKVMILRVIGVVTLFGFTLFLTRNYDPKIIGQYDFIRAFLLVAGSLCLLGTDQSILYFTGLLKSRGQIEELKNIYKKIIIMIFFMSLISFIILIVLGNNLIKSFFNDTNIYLIIFKATITLFFYCLTFFNTEVFRALDSIYIAELYRNTFKYVSVIIGAIILVNLNKESYLVDTFLFGFVILSIISTIMIFKLLDKKKSGFTDTKLEDFSFNFLAISKILLFLVSVTFSLKATPQINILLFSKITFFSLNFFRIFLKI